jgi:hypothetical protein
MFASTVPSDTSPEIDRMQLEIYRQMTPGSRWQLIDEMYRFARQIHAAGVRMRNSKASDDEILTDWFRVTLDKSLFEEVPRYRHGLGNRAI